ncbi:beta-N-acetylhexosaminidase [Saccharicrinis sp. GN24d3]|uniref:beta-N-acetylhexosaminidase n=1 Tax=Saccharicrinis sp. GN24d3 TaxID=3458416 RepID=UPI004035C534
MTKLIKIITLFLCNSLFATHAQELTHYLLPAPREINIDKGYLNEIQGAVIPNHNFIELIENISPFDIVGDVKTHSSPLTINTFSLEIDSALRNKQAYCLTIDSTSVKIVGRDNAALFYGKQTLQQILQYSKDTGKPIPCLSITDWPDFERRGYMLDISRDKVPTMETLYQLIDMLALWKINEFQLYTEHTFAYKNHRTVWKDASPITAEEVRMIDAYCKAKFIDLVPNQNSFGHMENWLMHDQYLHLAECPTDCNTIWGTRSRHSLNPLLPESFDLMQELYAELLPNFSSQYFNIGCDETVELGNGLSKQECQKHGKGKVYLDFVKKLNSEVNKYGRKAQFWGDIILKHPELISSIPENMTAMVWGYDSKYPFEENLPKFEEAGLDYYVCPGTSTWRSIIGRNKDAFTNLGRAAQYGKKFGAKGYLNTNWGDWGHWQPLSVCYPTLATGAAYSWNAQMDPMELIPTALNKFIFKDSTGNLTKALLKLGDAYLACEIPEGNANAFHLMLRRYRWTMKGHYQTKMLKKKNLLKAEQEIDTAILLLDQSAPMSRDAQITVDEIKQAAMLAKHGIHLGLARLNAKQLATENISPDTLQILANELDTLIKKHDELWTIRNREGGLQRSGQKLNDLLEFYKAID